MKHIKFKSDDKYYHVEYYGDKNNTVRRLERSDERFELLNSMIDRDSDKIEDCIIEIENSSSGETFCRVIRNVSYWDGLFIITWHEVVY